MRFLCTSNISNGVQPAMAEQDLTNPMYTAAYVDAISRLGTTVLIVGLWEEQNFRCGCPAILRSGRLNRTLDIESLPEIPQTDVFWPGLIDCCRRKKISELRIGTFGSRSAAIPRLIGETERTPRWEFVIDLKDRDLLMTLNATHRQRVRKAEKNGVTLVRSRDVSSLTELTRLTEASMERRSARGEDVPTAVDLDIGRALVEGGAAEVFLAVKNDRAVSSGVVVRATRGAYLHASGTDAVGMGIGASHFLNYQIAKALQDESLDTYNLGGTGDLESGLAKYKLNFGSRIVPLEAASVYLGSMFRKRFTTVAAELRSLSLDVTRRLRPARDRQEAAVGEMDK